MSLFSLGLVRAIVGQIVGTLVGMATTILFRVMLGQPAWAAEPAWTLGAVFGIIGALWGVGALTDWVKWMKGEETPFIHGPPVGVPAWTRYFGVDYNHKVIGVQYTVWGIFLLLVGGTVALIFRTELAESGRQFFAAVSGSSGAVGANSGGVVLINQDTADDWEETHDLTGTGTTLTASLVGAHVDDQVANVSTLFQCGMATLMVWRYEVYTPDNVLADCVVASGSETDPSAFYTLDTDGSGNFEGCANSNLW